MSQNNAPQDVLALIEADHRTVENLFSQAETAQDNNQLYSYFNQLYKELSLHTRAEELVFYPAMREYEELEDLIAEAEEEHVEAKELLEELKLLSPEAAEFKTKLSQLKDAVQHHVEEEESEIFEAVRECMGDVELQQLQGDFANAKKMIQADVESAMSS